MWSVRSVWINQLARQSLVGTMNINVYRLYDGASTAVPLLTCLALVSWPAALTS